MIDYYLKKHCPLGVDKRNPRCSGCVWNDKELNKCIFSIDYPKQVTIEEFRKRAEMVDEKQQERLSDPRRRFIVKASKEKMIINRVWAMPNRWTFTIKPIKELLNRYVGDGKGWIDPFAGKNSPAEITNDINPDMPTKYHIDALEFLKTQRDNSANGILLDPPYSITQAKECYNSYGMEELDIKVSSMAYWGNIKNNMARIIKPCGKAICCGWSSMGLGQGRGFEMCEILLVPHGGSKNDTIVTVEKKVNREEKKTLK